MADKFCWKFGTYDTAPIRCKIVKETAKQVKAQEPAWDRRGWRDRPSTMIKGQDCFMTFEEALAAMQKYTEYEISIKNKVIAELKNNLKEFEKNKGM